MSGATEDLLVFFAGTMLALLRGEAFFVGEPWSSSIAIGSPGSNICEGSIASPVFTFRARTDFLGDISTFAVVCRLVDLRGLVLRGAGVNSSSSFSSTTRLNSSSDSSTTRGFRVARRAGLAGDSIAAG